jgi:hypothetical protein
MKKSYHSMVVPTALATATRREAVPPREAVASRRESEASPEVNCDVPSRAYHATTAAGLSSVSMRNAVLGLICAAALGLALSDLTLFGIALWKIELAIVGAVLFVTAGKRKA